MVPQWVFTSFAKFQGIVSVSDFWLPIRLQELLQAPSGFLRSFRLARIRLDSLGGQVLYHNCISMTVARFTSITENFVICCYQVYARYHSTNTSLARSPCGFGPLTDFAISIFREMSRNTVITRHHSSQ